MKRDEFNDFLISTRKERDVILLNKGREYTQDDLDVLDNFKRNAETKRRKVHEAMKTKLKKLIPSLSEMSNDVLNEIIEEVNPVTPLLIWSVYFDKHYDAISSYIFSGDVKSEERIENRFFDGNNYLELGSALAFEKEQKRNSTVEIPLTKIFEDTTLYDKYTMEFDKDYKVYNIEEGESILNQCIGQHIVVTKLDSSPVFVGTPQEVHGQIFSPVIYIRFLTKEGSRQEHSLDFAKDGYIIRQSSVVAEILADLCGNKGVDVLNNKNSTEEAVKKKLEEIKTDVEDKFAGVNKIQELMEEKEMSTGNYSSFDSKGYEEIGKFSSVEGCKKVLGYFIDQEVVVKGATTKIEGKLLTVTIISPLSCCITIFDVVEKTVNTHRLNFEKEPVLRVYRKDDKTETVVEKLEKATSVTECKEILKNLKGKVVSITNLTLEGEVIGGTKGIITEVIPDTEHTCIVEVLKENRKIERCFLDFSLDKTCDVGWKDHE